MKRVLLLIDNVDIGGAQRQFVGLARLLKEIGYNVKVVYYHPLQSYKPVLDEAGVENVCPEGAANSFKRIFKIASEIKKFQPDMVISYLDTPNIVACLLKAVRFNYKLIVSERNTTQRLNRREKIKFFFMRAADSIVPNSYSQEKFIAEHYPNLMPKVTTITNFVDTDFFTPIEHEYRDCPRIITAARIAEQKNVKSYIEAIRILKSRGHEFTIDWYGDPINPYFAECQEMLKEYGLENVFTFHGPTTEILKEYQSCDAFCLPSIYEGFPNVVCEAMCCGKPILCSNVCDNPEIVEDGKNGYLFDPHSVDDIVDKMEKFLLLTKEHKMRMGEYSRELSLSKFSSIVFVEKYKTIIESC